MKKLTPGNIVLLCSLVVYMLVGILSLVFQYVFNDTINWGFSFLLSASSFVACYLLLRVILRRFIFERIKLVYRSIHDLKTGNLPVRKEVNMDEDVFHDVDTEVQAWAEFNRNEIEQLKKLEIYRREFVGNVSHELKTPIFAIQGYILTLLDGGLEDKTININYLQRAASNVDRMISIVEDLESISQLDAGQLKLYPEKFDVVALAKEVVMALEMKAESRGVKLVFREEYEPIRVTGDKEKIRQVFTNLIVNSIKYGKEQGTTELRFYDMDENILVEIADDGIGIAKHHLPRLFERFYRVDKGRSREEGGTGLGLAIVKHIIEAHNQTINVRSTEGVGSTFAFTLRKA
jgi:two-component system phosphate regulon sensor histidine kinase PhoR